MSPKRGIFTEHRRTKSKRVRILCLLTSVFLVIGNLAVTRITFSADGFILPNKSANQFIKPAATPEPENAAPSNVPPQTSAFRIKLMIGETRDVSVTGAADSIMVISPEIASAQIKNGSVLTITGVKIGETILIISGGGKRQTFIVEVAWQPPVSVRQNLIDTKQAFSENAKMSGSYNISYTKNSEQNLSLVRNRFELRRKLSEDRTLRVSGEMYKFFGGDNRQKGFGRFQNYGLDRISVGVDSTDKTIDFLDSQVRISPVISNSFEMRGFHLTSTPKLSKNPDLLRKGIEIFAGQARPTSVFYDKTRAKLFGAMIPVASGDSWQARAGFISVIAPKDNQFGRGGTAFQLNASYAPNKRFSADGDISYANGSLSWGARLNFRLKKFGALTEFSRVDKNSALGSLYALAGGRQTEAFSVYWRPEKRFNFSARYNHTNVERLTNSRFASFNRSTFSANASYSSDRNSRFNFRFTDQQIETAAPGNSSKFQIATKTFTAGYNTRINQHLSNDFEAGINFSREANAKSELETGFSLRELLRFSWSRNSLTGFFNYTNKTTSLTSLIMRNPQLLPLELQPVFALNPALFLQVYRERLAFLLPGVELPQTRNMDAGVRFQTTVSRFALTGETRYGTSEIYSQNQKNLFTSIDVDFRLDAANSIQINGWHSFSANNQSGIIFGFTHRFGGDSGGGFQFPGFLGLTKGKVSGRVYYDLNGNGQDEANEPGVANITVQLNEKRGVKTDAEGRYVFSANEGRYNIALISDDLGVRLRASTATRRQISISSRKTINVSFGVSGFGFVSGRVFNDSGLTAETSKSNRSGVEAVKLVLRSLDTESETFVAEQASDSGGTYEFRNLRPGNYRLEIDSSTLPANFRLPAQSSWEITVLPLQGFYSDIPIIAQRAATGVVFVDTDGDGKFTPQRDEPVEGAYITADDAVAVSDRNGSYILRNLPAGKIKINVRVSAGAVSPPIFIELSAEPVTRRAVDFAVKR